MTDIRWWWVRHAPCRAHGAVGWSDVPADLSDKAWLDRLKSHLPGNAAVLTSDLRRSIDTADALALPGPRLASEPGLREINFGDWEGRSFDEIGAGSTREFFDDPGPARPPRGESLDDLTARVLPCIERINATPPCEDIVVIGHAGVIRAMLATQAGIGHRASLRFAVEPLSITRLDWLAEASGWRVDRVNHQTGGGQGVVSI